MVNPMKIYLHVNLSKAYFINYNTENAINFIFPVPTSKPQEVVFDKNA